MKNRSFWIVMLVKTLESPLDSKEIKPVNPKGNQPWIFIGRTDAEAEAPILWPPDVKSQLTRKDLDSEKDRRQEKKGAKRGWYGWMVSSTQWTRVWANCSMSGFPVHHELWSLFKLVSIELVMPSNYPILCHPLLLLPSNFSRIRVFSSESVLCTRWPKYWSFSFSISPSNEYSGLIFFKIDWFDLLGVQVILKSLLQHHSSKASILWCSAFFIVQFSHPYMITRKTIALTRWTFVGKVVPLLFNMPSR